MLTLLLVLGAVTCSPVPSNPPALSDSAHIEVTHEVRHVTYEVSEEVNEATASSHILSSDVPPEEDPPIPTVTTPHTAPEEHPPQDDDIAAKEPEVSEESESEISHETSPELEVSVDEEANSEEKEAEVTQEEIEESDSENDSGSEKSNIEIGELVPESRSFVSDDNENSQQENGEQENGEVAVEETDAATVIAPSADPTDDSHAEQVYQEESVELIESEPTIPVEAELTNPVEPEPTSSVEPEPASPVEVEPTSHVEPEPEPTSPLEPEPTSHVEPEPTSPVEPEPTRNVESEPLSPVKPEPSHPVEPEPTSLVEPEPTNPVEPEPTSPIEPEHTSPVEPEPTNPVEPEPTSPVEPEHTSPVEPEPTSLVEPEPTSPVELEPTSPVEPESLSLVENESINPVVAELSDPAELDSTSHVEADSTIHVEPEHTSQDEAEPTVLVEPEHTSQDEAESTIHVEPEHTSLDEAEPTIHFEPEHTSQDEADPTSQTKDELASQAEAEPVSEILDEPTVDEPTEDEPTVPLDDELASSVEAEPTSSVEDVNTSQVEEEATNLAENEPTDVSENGEPEVIVSHDHVFTGEVFEEVPSQNSQESEDGSEFLETEKRTDDTSLPVHEDASQESNNEAPDAVAPKVEITRESRVYFDYGEPSNHESSHEEKIVPEQHDSHKKEESKPINSGLESLSMTSPTPESLPDDVLDVDDLEDEALSEDYLEYPEEAVLPDIPELDSREENSTLATDAEEPDVAPEVVITPPSSSVAPLPSEEFTDSYSDPLEESGNLPDFDVTHEQLPSKTYPVPEETQLIPEKTHDHTGELSEGDSSDLATGDHKLEVDSGIPRVLLPQQEQISAAAPSALTPGCIVAIVFGVLISLVVILGVGGFMIWQRRTQNRPKVLGNDQGYAGSDSGGYIDDQVRVSYVNSQTDTPKGSPEDLISLDNDSFLNSLESMTIQNLWTDNIRHTKL